MAARLKSCLTDEEFRRIVAESLSVRQVLSRIGLVRRGVITKQCITVLPDWS